MIGSTSESDIATLSMDDMNSIVSAMGKAADDYALEMLRRQYAYGNPTTYEIMKPKKKKKLKPKQKRPVPFEKRQTPFADRGLTNYA